MLINNLENYQLPSNRNFGIFFFTVFLVLGVYFLFQKTVILSFTFILISSIFLTLALMKPLKLTYLNKLWMKFGIVLGKIVSPIILGAIFFVIFTSFAIIMKLFERDELNLKMKRKKSYWKNRQNVSKKNKSFKNQF